MVKTMLATATLAEWYLGESWGGGHAGYHAQGLFRERLLHGQRVGQAFFNSLRHEDAERLRGTLHDPFNYGVAKTHEAIDFLCTKEK